MPNMRTRCFVLLLAFYCRFSSGPVGLAQTTFAEVILPTRIYCLISPLHARHWLPSGPCLYLACCIATLLRDDGACHLPAGTQDGGVWRWITPHSGDSVACYTALYVSYYISPSFLDYLAYYHSPFYLHLLVTCVRWDDSLACSAVHTAYYHGLLLPTAIPDNTGVWHA